MLTRRFLSFTIIFLSLIFASTEAIGQCANSLDWEFNPPPVNGAYEPGQVVNVCLTFSTYQQTAISWFHGVVLQFPPGWDVSTVTNTSAPSACSSSNGIWSYYPNGTTATGSGQTFGPGFFYDANSGGPQDGNPGNNYGDPCTTFPANFSFCFDITIDNACGGSGNPLDGNVITPSVQITGDGQSGSFSGTWGACTQIATIDPDIDPITINCCDAEAGTSPGTILICENGNFNLIGELGAPVDSGGTWTGPAGYIDPSADGYGTFDPLTDPAGEYTYTVSGTDDCVSTSTINMEFNTLGQIQSLATCISVPTDISSLVTVIPLPPGGTWYEPGYPSVQVEVPGGIVDPAVNVPGVYTYTFYNGGNCLTTLEFELIFGTLGAVGLAGSAEVCSSDPGCYQPFYDLGGNPIQAGNWIVSDSMGTGFLGSFPTWDACIDFSTFHPINPSTGDPYYGDFVLTHLLSSPGCPITYVQVTVDVYEPADTGENTVLSVCITDNVLLLDTLLNGTPEIGYSWTESVTGDPVSNLFDPGLYNAGDNLQLLYTGGFTGTSCESTTLLDLTVLPAFAYAGEDNTITVCQADASIYMLDSIPGNGTLIPQTGGTFMDSALNNYGEYFTPGSNPVGTYVFTYNINSTCADDQSTLTIILEPSLYPGLGSTLDVCDNATNIPLSDGLSGPFATTGVWTNASGIVVPSTIDGTTVTDGAIFTYTVGTDPCKESADVIVNLIPSPYAGVLTTTPQNYCDSDASFALSSLFTTSPTPPPGGTPVGWTDPSGNAVTTVNPADGSSASGVYTYTIDDYGCGAASVSITITIEDTPSAGGDASITACPNGTATIDLFQELGGTPVSGGTWTDPSNNPSTGIFDPTANDPAGVYTYTAGTNCTDDATVTVSYATLPNPGISNSISVCAGDPAFNLLDEMGSGAIEGTWSNSTNPNFGSTFNPATDPAGVYTNTVSGACPSVSATLTIIVTPLPDAGADAITSFCETDGNVDITSYLNGTPESTGVWTDGAGNSVSNPLNVASLCGNSYVYTYTVGSGTCSSSSTLSFDVICNPNAGSDGTLEICASSSSFSLFTGLTGTYDPAGEWTNSGGIIVADPTNMDPSSLGTGDTFTYTVSASPCFTASANVVVDITPAITATNIDASCTAAQTDYILTFDIVGGQGPYTVTAGNPGTIVGNTYTSNTIPEGDSYSVTISDASSCADFVITGASPDCNCSVNASFSSGNETICIGSSATIAVNLSGDIDGNYSFIYSDGTNPDVTISGASNGETFIVSPTTTTTYTMVSATNGSCTGNASGSVTITVEQLPDAGNDISLNYCSDGSTLVLVPAPGEPTGGTFNPTSITLDEGTNVASYTMSGNVCPDDIADYTLNIDPLLEIANLNAVCAPNQLEYTVTFDIVGGTPPYYVDGVLNGSSYSETITFDPLDLTFGYVIADSGPCDDINIDEAAPDCNCIAEGSISGSTPICTGSCTDIIFTGIGDGPFDITYTNSVSGATTTLTDINNGHIISVCPTANTTYTLTSIYDSYCEGEVTGSPVLVTVDSPVVISNFTETCDDTAEFYQVQFTYSGGFGPYTFSPSNTSTIPGNYLSGPIASGLGYNIVVGNAGSCPDVSISETAHTCACLSDGGSLSASSFEICFGETASVSTNGSETLDGNDIHQYVLHNGTAGSIGTVIATSTTGSFTFNYPTMVPGTAYFINSVVGNSISGNVDLSDDCTSLSNGVQVIVNALPTATISGGGIVCPGESIDLIVTRSGEGAWDFEYAVDGVAQGNQTIPSNDQFILTVTQPGEYTLVSTSDANCEGSFSGSVTVENYETPTATLAGLPTVCEGSGDGPEVSFTGDGPWNFIYSIDGIDQQPVNTSFATYTIPVEVGGNYALVSLEGANCEGTVSGSQEIEILAAPTATINGGGTVCAGDSATFDVVLTGTGPWNVQYTIDGIPQNLLSGITDGYSFQSTIDGDYVLVSVSDANCIGQVLSSQASLLVNPLPTAEITTSTSSVCIGEEVQIGIDLEGVPPYNVTYVLNGDTVVATGLYNDYFQTLQPENPVNFEVLFIEDGSNPTCSSELTEFTYIDAVTLPNAPVLTSDTICVYNGPVTIGVNAAPGLSYSWSPETYLSNPGSANTLFQPSLTSPYAKVFEYVLTATNGLCTASDTLTMTLEPGPKANFSFSPDPVSSEDPTVFFENNTIGRDEVFYFWEFDSLGTSSDFEPIYKFPDGINDSYTVTLTAIDPITGCIGDFSDVIDIKPEMLIYVPNAFTPDGDGLNDLWAPVLTNVDADDYKLSVYSRLGNLVFSTTDATQKWNGGMMNDNYFVEPGVYVWMIETKNNVSLDEITMKGIVTVVR